MGHFLPNAIEHGQRFFIDQPLGLWVAFLAITAMMLNMPVMFYDRGFSKLMAVPHIVPWTILVVLLIGWRPEGSALYQTYLTVLIVTNTISLLFDYKDALL